VEFLRSDAVRWGLAGVLGLFLLWLIRAGYRWFSTSEDRELERQLQEALADGDNKKAGDIQVRRGNLLEASRIFVRSGEHGRAGNVLEMLGQPKQAAEEYEKASEWAKAGPLFKKTGDVARAAACFEKSTERADRVAAAECWALAKEPLKAARIFQDVEEFEKAADEYAKLDDLDSPEVALTMLENAALAAKEDKKKRTRLWVRAAELGLKLGAFERAARAYDEAGESQKAAGIYENALKKLDVAAALYAEAGDMASAKRLTLAAGGAETVLEARLARARARGDAGLLATLASEKDGSSGKSDGAGKKDAAPGKTAATLVNLDDPGAAAIEDARPPKRKGEQLGDRFELMGELGRGGMGVVYRARDVRLGRFVALKFLPDDVESGSTLSRLFKREARAAAALSHAGIVTVYDVGEIDGREFIAMELVDGTTLDRVLEDGGPLPANDALELMEKVLEAIEYAHGKMVIHRDLKPANLMRTKSGIKVMDFGLAKVVTSKSSGGQTVVGGELHAARAGDRERRSPLRRVLARRDLLRALDRRLARSARRAGERRDELSLAARARAERAGSALGAHHALSGARPERPGTGRRQRAARGPGDPHRARRQLEARGGEASGRASGPAGAGREPSPSSGRSHGSRGPAGARRARSCEEARRGAHQPRRRRLRLRAAEGRTGARGSRAGSAEKAAPGPHRSRGRGRRRAASRASRAHRARTEGGLPGAAREALTALRPGAVSAPGRSARRPPR
jgi:tetratricopeptide (TPR) repeat protein